MDGFATITQKKIVLLGDFAVGKTSLVRRFIEGRFDDKYLSTIGVKISRRLVLVSERQVNLLLWDLAGAEEYTGVQTSYLQGAQGGLLVCDLTRTSTLQYLHKYAERLREVNPRSSLLIAGNKADLEAQRQISNEELGQVASDFGAGWFVTSAKSGDGVEQAFEQLAENMLRL